MRVKKSGGNKKSWGKKKEGKKKEGKKKIILQKGRKKSSKIELCKIF